MAVNHLHRANNGHLIHVNSGHLVWGVKVSSPAPDTPTYIKLWHSMERYAEARYPYSSTSDIDYEMAGRNCETQLLQTPFYPDTTHVEFETETRLRCTYNPYGETPSFWCYNYEILITYDFERDWPGWAAWATGRKGMKDIAWQMRYSGVNRAIDAEVNIWTRDDDPNEYSNILIPSEAVSQTISLAANAGSGTMTGTFTDTIPVRRFVCFTYRFKSNTLVTSGRTGLSFYLLQSRIWDNVITSFTFVDI